MGIIKASEEGLEYSVVDSEGLGGCDDDGRNAAESEGHTATVETRVDRPELSVP